MSDTSDSESTSSERSNKDGKEEQPLSMEEGCSICEITDANDVDPLVYCDQCNVAVHKLCYGIKTIPEGDWFCNIVSLTLATLLSASRFFISLCSAFD